MKPARWWTRDRPRRLPRCRRSTRRCCGDAGRVGVTTRRPPRSGPRHCLVMLDYLLPALAPADAHGFRSVDAAPDLRGKSTDDIELCGFDCSVRANVVYG